MVSDAVRRTLTFNTVAAVLDARALYRVEYLEYIGFNCAAAVSLLAFQRAVGRHQFKSASNRVYFAALGFGGLSTLGMFLVGWIFTLPFKWLLVFVNIPMFACVAIVSYAIDARLYPVAVIYACTTVVGAIWPQHAYVWSAVTAYVVTYWFSRTFVRSIEERARARDRARDGVEIETE